MTTHTRSVADLTHHRIAYAAHRARITTIPGYPLMTSSQYAVLAVLEDGAGHPVLDIHRTTKIDRATTDTILNRLRDKKFVAVTSEKRGFRVNITETGLEALLAFTRYAEEREAMLMSRIGTPAEQEEFLRILTKLVDNLEKRKAFT
jgi:DNA-binding MarR family transcriptional regulator